MFEVLKKGFLNFIFDPFDQSWCKMNQKQCINRQKKGSYIERNVYFSCITW